MMVGRGLSAGVDSVGVVVETVGIKGGGAIVGGGMVGIVETTRGPPKKFCLGIAGWSVTGKAPGVAPVWFIQFAEPCG